MGLNECGLQEASFYFVLPFHTLDSISLVAESFSNNRGDRVFVRKFVVVIYIVILFIVFVNISSVGHVRFVYFHENSLRHRVIRSLGRRFFAIRHHDRPNVLTVLTGLTALTVLNKNNENYFHELLERMSLIHFLRSFQFFSPTLFRLSPNSSEFAKISAKLFFTFLVKLNIDKNTDFYWLSPNS